MSFDTSQVKNLQNTTETHSSVKIDFVGNSEVGKNKSELSSLSSELGKIRNDEVQKHGLLKSEIGASQVTQKELNAAKSRVNSVSQEVQSMTANVADQRNNVNSSKLNMNNLQEQLNASKAKDPNSQETAKLEVMLQTSENRFNEESERLSALESNLDRARGELKDAKSQMASLSDLSTKQDSSISFLKSDVNSLGGKSQSLSGNINSGSTAANATAGAQRGSNNRNNRNNNSNVGIAGSINSINNLLQQGQNAQNNMGDNYLGAAKQMLKLIANLYRTGISSNAIINNAKHNTAKSLAQQGISAAEAGLAQVVTSTSNVAYELRTTLARLNGISGLSQEGKQYWTDVTKANFVKGVSEGSDLIQTS